MGNGEGDILATAVGSSSLLGALLFRRSGKHGKSSGSVSTTAFLTKRG